MKRISRVDREALARALAMDDEPIDRRLDPERWFLAARSAAYACQCAALRLQPWQPVPVTMMGRRSWGAGQRPSCCDACWRLGSVDMSLIR
jgi:hypothetical protein